MVHTTKTKFVGFCNAFWQHEKSKNFATQMFSTGVFVGSAKAESACLCPKTMFLFSFQESDALFGLQVGTEGPF